VVLEAFGPRRLMLDLTGRADVASSYERWVSTVQRAICHVVSPEQEWVFSKTALKHTTGISGRVKMRLRDLGKRSLFRNEKSLKPCSPPRFSPTLHFFRAMTIYLVFLSAVFQTACRSFQMRV